VSPEVVLVNEMIVVDEIFLTSVVGRVNVDALNPPLEGHIEIAECIKVIPFNDEVSPRGISAGKGGVKVKGYKVAVESLIPLNLIRLPDKTEFRGIPPITSLKQGNQLLRGKVIVISAHSG
jgi:hypothetical protein